MALRIKQTTVLFSLLSILFVMEMSAYTVEAAAVSSTRLGSAFRSYTDSRENLLQPCGILCRLFSVENDNPPNLDGSRSSAEKYIRPSAAEWISFASGSSKKLHKVRSVRSPPFDDPEPNNYDCENSPDDDDDGPFQDENCQRKPPSGHLHPTAGVVSINCDQDPAHPNCQEVPAE